MSKTVWKAIIAVLILAVVVFLFIKLMPGLKENNEAAKATPENTETAVIVSYNANDVVALEASAKEDFNVIKTDSGSWICKTPSDVTTTDSAISNIVNLLNEMTGSVVFAEGEYKGDLAQFGLANPAKLSIVMKDGTKHTLLTGKEAPSKQGYYLMTEDSDAIYMVASVFARKLVLDRTDLIAGNLMEFAETGKIKEISVEKSGEKVVTMVADFSATTDDSNKAWNLTYPLNCQANTTEVNGLIETVTGLTVYDIVEPEGANLADYGLDNPILRVSMTDNKGTQSFALGNLNGRYYYCTIGDSTAVFTVSNEYIKFVDNTALNYAYAYPFFETYTNLSEIDIEIFGNVNENHKLTFQFGDDSERLVLDGQPSKEFDNDGKEIFNYDYEFKGITTYCYAVQLDGIEPEQKYEKGALLGRITYTRQDGSKAVVEAYEREEGTMYLYLDGKYFGGYADKWRIFSEEDHQGLLGTIKAYKKLLNS